MGALGRIYTDPASVNYETDWGVWNWLSAGALAGTATLIIALAGVAAFVAINLAEETDALGWMLGAGVVALVALPIGLYLVARAAHGMARHTAHMGWVVAIIVAVYVLSYLLFWQLGTRLARMSSPPTLHWEIEGGWWRRILVATGGVYAVLAIINLSIEILNKMSSATGLAISLILFVSVLFGAALALNSISRVR